MTLYPGIQSALAAMTVSPLADAAQTLLAEMGYRSSRTLSGQAGDVFDFLTQFPAENPNTESERAFRADAKSARFLFQLTDTEIGIEGSEQGILFDSDSLDQSITSSFLFVAVELEKTGYSRGKYAQFTREINKRLSQPAVVLFRTAGGLLSLAFPHRRPSKRDDNRDVLGRVSLIREINPASPHPAHRLILDELSLDGRLAWMRQRLRRPNFDSLFDAWLNALDTEALNKQFYLELQGWFDRAIMEATFPVYQAEHLKPEEHVMRLITRLLFVWFIKEKGLVANELFVEPQVQQLLKNYDPSGGDTYYRAVLQNLFFATLNTEIGRRRFRRNNEDHRNPSRYRFQSEIADPDLLQKFFRRTPFINGGLFDCLDGFEARAEGGYQIDCFTDNVIDPEQPEFGILSIPNPLFFDDAGLIPLLERYKFTVEENTPVEKEVALDPELLGKVFENLLAANLDETRETARHQTGSYYTPRVVVDYMVDEALVTALADNTQPSISDDRYWRDRLRYLLNFEAAFDDAEELFSDVEKDDIVRAISGIKVLDPAVGSGAFPMSILHKLTLALRRLDPVNIRWEELQKALARQRAASAFETTNQRERDAELTDISATFEKYRDSDLGRKLYLIRNSIFGVDIQPMAGQIAKLRFFISLAIEQESNNKPDDNYGIKPLPNLETRFVAANTLLGLGKLSQRQMNLVDPVLSDLQQQLGANQERQFHAATRGAKLQYRSEAQRLRVGLGAELERLGMPAADAEKVSEWDPDDPNAPAAEWFNVEYMFGIKDGFDVVIGNPPYIQLQKNGGEVGRRYRDANYETFLRTGDIYQLFYERGCRLLRPSRGLLAYITSNSWLKAEYGKPLRRFFFERHRPLALLEMGKDVFENTFVDTSVLILREGGSASAFPAADVDRLPKLGVDGEPTLPPIENLPKQVRPYGDGPWPILSNLEHRVIDKMQANGTPLKEWDVRINRGILTGYNAAFIIDKSTRQQLVAQDPNSADIIKPILRGRDIQRYRAQWAGRYLINTHNGYGNVPAIDIKNYPVIRNHLDRFYRDLEKRQDKGRTPYNLRNCAYHKEFAQEKLFWMDLTEQGRFAYDVGETYAVNTVYMLTGREIRYLSAILNASLTTWFMKNSGVTSGMGVTRWFLVSVATIPIPKISASEQQSFINLVDAILTAKEADPSADTSGQEAEIDRLVYGLYGLTAEEIDAVEKSL